MRPPSFARNVVSGCGCATGCLGVLGAGLAVVLLLLGPLGQATRSEATVLFRIGVPLLVVCTLAIVAGPIGWLAGLLLDPTDDEP